MQLEGIMSLKHKDTGMYTEGVLHYIFWELEESPTQEHDAESRAHKFFTSLTG